MGGWDDVSYYEAEAAKEEFIEATLREMSEEGVRTYLGTYGDAIDERVKSAIGESAKLLALGFYSPAAVTATIAIELTVRYFLVRPLVQAAFLSEEWAGLLTERIASGRNADDRNLLTNVLSLHTVDIASLKADNGKPIWRAILSDVYPKRNKIVHAGATATAIEAKLAVSCAEKLRTDVVLPLAKRHGFTLDSTGCWNTIKTKNSSSRFKALSPFQ